MKMRKLFLSLILGISLLSCIHEESDIFQDETELSSSNFNSRFWSENIIIRGGNGNEKPFLIGILACWIGLNKTHVDTECQIINMGYHEKTTFVYHNSFGSN